MQDNTQIIEDWSLKTEEGRGCLVGIQKRVHLPWQFLEACSAVQCAWFHPIKVVYTWMDHLFQLCIIWETENKCIGKAKCTHFLCTAQTGSANRSLRSRVLPFSLTSGCLRTRSQPQCAKKKPRLALCGSASVSEYLWWTLWSRDHSMMSFYSSSLHLYIHTHARCLHRQ